MAGRGERLLDRARNHPDSLSFNEFERLLKDKGWRQVRQEGSHRVWRSPGGYMLPIQPRKKDAKGYQVRQFLKQLDKEQTSGSKP